MTLSKTYALGAVFVLVSGSVSAQDGDFGAFAGQYYDEALPAEILCPFAEWVLSADGQLRSLKVGPSALELSHGYVCEAGDRYATCATADVVDGALHVPPTSQAPSFKRLTLLDEGVIALGQMDGDGKPEILARCPSDYQPALPHATHEAFNATPPPAVIGAAAFDVAGATDAAWQSVDLAPLPISGVYGDFVLSQQSIQMMEAMSQMAAHLTDEQLGDISREDATPERLQQAFRMQQCGSQPRIFTQDGLMVILRIGTAQGDDLRKASISAVFACHEGEDALLSCRKARKEGTSFAPDPKGEVRTYALNERTATEPHLCLPGKTSADDNSCVALVPCDPAMAPVSLRGTETLISDLVTWRP